MAMLIAMPVLFYAFYISTLYFHRRPLSANMALVYIVIGILFIGGLLYKIEESGGLVGALAFVSHRRANTSTAGPGLPGLVHYANRIRWHPGYQSETISEHRQTSQRTPTGRTPYQNYRPPDRPALQKHRSQIHGWSGGTKLNIFSQEAAKESGESRNRMGSKNGYR